MKSHYRTCFYLLNLLSFFFLQAHSQRNDIERSLSRKYDFSRQHSQESQRFVMESRLVQLAADGSRKDSTIYTLHIQSTPIKNKDEGDRFTCTRFTVRTNNAPEISIPSLIGWSYTYTATENGKDEKGQVLGIDHSKFENIIDSAGAALPLEKMYHVYNAFIDFHSLFIFADPALKGKGVQDLHQAGDKIVHFAAFSEPPVNLGKQIKEGSVFRNGEVTLLFKGLGTIKNRGCVILGYDSGQSSFKMIMEPVPSMQMNTTGSSHYWGDIYKDIENGWVQYATLHEIVVSETVSGVNQFHSVVERSIELKNLK
jgi:hypothetical protein